MKRVDVYKITNELKIKSTPHKALLFSKNFPFFRIGEKSYYGENTRYSYLVAESKEDALERGKERYVTYKEGDVLERGHISVGGYTCKEPIITDVKKVVKLVSRTMEELEEDLKSQDFIKYCTYWNMRYKEFFTVDEAN